MTDVETVGASLWLIYARCSGFFGHQWWRLIHLYLLLRRFCLKVAEISHGAGHAGSLGLSSSVRKIKRCTTGRKNSKEQLVPTGMMSLLSSVAVHTQENGKYKCAPSLGFTWRCGCHDHVVVLLSKLPGVSYEEVHLCSYQTRTYLYLCTEPSPHSVSECWNLHHSTFHKINCNTGFLYSLLLSAGQRVVCLW